MDAIYNNLIQNEEYIKDLEDIEEVYNDNSKKYTITNIEAKRNAVNEVTVQNVKDVFVSTVIGYEKIIKSKENEFTALSEKYLDVNEKVNLYEKTIKDLNVPVPKLKHRERKSVMRDESDLELLNMGGHRVISFINSNYTEGSKFYIADKDGNKQKAYRVKNS